MRAYLETCGWAVRRFVCLPCLLVYSRCIRFLWRNLAQMSLMEKTGSTPSASGAQKALFLCSEPCTNMHPCFSFSVLNLRDQVSDLSDLGFVSVVASPPLLFVGSTVRF